MPNDAGDGGAFFIIKSDDFSIDNDDFPLKITIFPLKIMILLTGGARRVGRDLAGLRIAAGIRSGYSRRI